MTLLDYPGVPHPRRVFAFATTLVGVCAVAVDAFAINIILPAVARDFDLSPAAVTLLITVYQIVIIASILPLAALGEVIGHRVLYLSGLAGFAVAAFACALAQDFQTLLIARTVQSFAGACIMSNNIALIRTIVPGAKLGRAVGFNATSVALASTLGPVVAGSALALADWRSVFAISAPFSVVALVVGLFALPPNEAREGRKFDVGGAILSALAFGFGFVALGGASHDRPLMEIALCAIIGLLAGAMLLHRTRTSANPVLPLDLLKIPIIGLSSAAAVCCFAAEMIAFVAMPFLLESQFGLTSISVGFIIAAWPFAIMLLAPIVGNFADRVAPGPLGAGGLAVMGIGLVLVALLPPDASIANIVWRVAICGVGFVTFQTPNNRTIVASAPRPRSGSAGGLISTSRLTGQTVGTLAVSLALAHGHSWRFTLALAFSAAFAFLGAAFSVQRRGRV